MTNHRYPRLTALLLAMLMVFNMAASAAADGGPETVPSEGTGSGFILVEEADLGGSGFSASEQLKDDSGNAVADFRTADPNRKYTLELTVTEGSEAFPEDTESVRMSYPLQNMTAQDGENDEVSWTYDASARQLVFRWKNGKQSRVAATIAVAADYPAEQDLSGRYVLVSGNGAMLGYETFTLDNRDKLLAVPATVTDGKVRPDTWQDAAWVLTHVTGDYYTIRSAETGKYLYISAKNENGYKANSLYLTQADEKTAQRIQAVSAGSGNWSFQLNKAAVNNSGNNPEKGFGSWTYAGSSNEVFHLYPESAVDHEPTKDLSGTWGIYRGTGSNHSFVANRINDKGRLAAIRMDVKDGVIYPQDDIPEWTFVHVNRDWYYVRCGSEYLNISNSGASLSDTPQALYAKSDTGYSDFALMTDSATSKAFALSNVGAMAENGYGSEKGNINDRTRFTLTDDAIRNTEISGTWAIVTESTGTALTSKKKDEQRLTSAPYAMTQNGNAFSSEGKIDEWTFTRVNGNWYTVRNQDGKYLDLTHERVTMSETETTVYIHESEGRYRLTNGGRYALNNSFYANSYGPKNSGNNLSQNEWHTLVHAVKEDMDILGFNLNGGTVNEAPAALELEPGTTVILPELDGTKNGEAFLGWSDVKDFYSLNPGTNHRYREVIRAGSEYTAGDGQETLYAVWNDPNKKVKFGIRENGVLQNEPSDYPVTAYKGHLWLDDALDEGLWVIDIDGTKEIKDYYMDNRVAASVKKLPTVAQIQEALRAEGSKVTFDPETQYIHWYVLKRLEKEWHVDGVIRNRSEISVTYNENVPASERGSVQNVAGGYQFARGTEITIGAQKGSSEALIPQRSGYVFAGWNTRADGTGDAYRSGETAQPENNLSLYARWMTEAEYSGHTVTYYVDGVQDGDAENHDYGAPLTARTVESREGYTFSGWSGLPETMPDSDVEVTGSWTINRHQVKYIIDGVQDGETETYEYGAELTARTVEAREGYTFSGWSGLPETMPDHDVKVTGSWTINSHQVKYIIDGVQDGNAETYEYGAELTARTVEAREGYTFSGWSGLPETMPDNDVEVTGSWTINRHQVKYIIDGVQDGEAEDYDYGTPLTERTVEAREGYTFSGWSGLPETMPDNDVEVTGSWTINSHQVKYIIDGVQDGEAETYEYGTELTARTVEAREGYTFSGWSGLPETMPDNDVEVTGSWTINNHQVKYIIDGVQDGETETYEYGTELTARTVEAREGYTFSEWSGLPETMPDSDVEVTGSWTINEYTVTFTDEDGTVLQSGKVPYGTVPAFEGQDPEKAEDSEHVYRYIGWDREIVPATEDVTYTAVYRTLTKVILTAESAAREYNGAEQRISGFSCSVDGLEFTGVAAAGSGKNAGTYENAFTGVTPGETMDSTGNYIVAETRNGTLTITPKAATIIVHDLEITYGDEEPELTSGTEGTAGMDHLFRKLSRQEGTDAGTYVITAVPTEDPNYTITVADGTLTIHPRPVTVAAENKAKVYGSAEPELTGRIEGLAAGDTEDMIRFALERTAGEDAGEYTIRASGEANQGNYTVTFTDGIMTILPADTVLVRIAANSGTFLYDGTEKNLDGYTVTGISSPLYSESDFTFTGSSELRGTDAGVYRTEMTGADFRNLNGNFANVVFEVTNGTLEITRRKITLTSGSAEAPYSGAALTADDVTADGDEFVPGEEPAVTVTGIRIREGTSENTFRWSFAEDVNPENYEITAVYGTLTVTPAITHTLTVRYLDENGNEAGIFTREYTAGEAYRVKTPELAGYRAEQEWVTGEMGDTDVTFTVNYTPLTYTLTVEFISEKDGSRVADPVVLRLRGGQAFRVQAPETAGYTPVRQAAVGTMPNANRRITIAMIPDVPAEEAGGNRQVTEIGEYGTAQGSMNNAAAIGDVYE